MQAVIFVAGWLAGWWLLWRVPRLPSGHRPAGARRGHRAAPRAATTDEADGAVTAGDGTTLRVAVIIPARDEAVSLPTLLASLAVQTRPADEVIVVDDASTDGTGELARSFDGVRVISGAALPPGWTGKSWACHQGVTAASADVVVFLDADVALAPDALAALVTAHRRHGGLVTVQPHHRVVRPYERLSAVFNLVGVMGVGMASPRLRRTALPRRTAGAFGPCMVMSRHDYDRVGGHASVRAEIIEDIAFGRRCAARGVPVRAFAGGDLLSFRMYPLGIGQLVEGWSKNFASGAGATPPLRLALVGLWVAASLGAVQWAVAGLSGAPVAPAVVVVAAVAVQQAVMLRQVGTFGPLTAVAFPFTFAAFVAVFAYSVWLSKVRRQVSWRGRAIPLGAADSLVVAPGEAGSVA